MKTKCLILLTLMFVNGVGAIAAGAVTNDPIRGTTTVEQSAPCDPYKTKCS